MGTTTSNIAFHKRPERMRHIARQTDKDVMEIESCENEMKDTLTEHAVTIPSKQEPVRKIPTKAWITQSTTKMGCEESRHVSKQPGKGVVADDTTIDDYEDNWEVTQTQKSTTNKSTNGHLIVNKSISNNNNIEKSSNGNIIHEKSSSGMEKQNQPIPVSKNTHVFAPNYSKQSPQKTVQNITNVVDLEEYD